MPKPYRYPWSLVYFLQPSYYKMNKDIIECLTSKIIVRLPNARLMNLGGRFR